MYGHKYLGDERVPVFAVGQSKSNFKIQMMPFETKHRKLVYTVRAELPQKSVVDFLDGEVLFFY